MHTGVLDKELLYKRFICQVNGVELRASVDGVEESH